MNNNINTKEYWEERFSSGDWEEKGGRWQTKSFAKGQVSHLKIPRDFAGAIVDFGCGLGDAAQVYKKAFPGAELVGVDISQAAIDMCRKRYGSMATFIQGDYQAVPCADVIIASNVLEHLSGDVEIARNLMLRCDSLYIIVPYKEWPLSPEHVNTYDENYYSILGAYDWQIFTCKGWSQRGLELWYHVYFKNIHRLLSGGQACRRGMQIMFHLKGSVSAIRR